MASSQVTHTTGSASGSRLQSLTECVTRLAVADPRCVGSSPATAACARRVNGYNRHSTAEPVASCAGPSVWRRSAFSSELPVVHEPEAMDAVSMSFIVLGAHPFVGAL